MPAASCSSRCSVNLQASGTASTAPAAYALSAHSLRSWSTVSTLLLAVVRICSVI